MSVINRRAENKSVCLFSFFNNLIDDIVIKDATVVQFSAGTAADAVPISRFSQLDNFCFNAFVVQNLCNFGQRRVGTPLFIAAAVNH